MLCYLAVLKDFGDANRAPLSFPIAGWTLALDLPRAAEGLEDLLQRFDELVAQAGGRIYLSKDDRVRPDALAAMYPRLDEWREARDRADPAGLWRSDLGQRAGLIQPAGDPRSRPLRAMASSARRVLLLGGSSEIGLAIVRRLVREGPVRPYLIGRDRERLALGAGRVFVQRSFPSPGKNERWSMYSPPAPRTKHILRKHVQPPIVCLPIE